MASNQFTTDGQQVLRIRDSYVEPVNSDSLPNSLSGIWFEAGEKYYVVGDGLFSSSNLGKAWIEEDFLPVYKSDIKGLETNDIFVTGSHGLVSHYNGSSWHHYSGNELPVIYGAIGSIYFDGSFFISAGWMGENAIIVRSFR